MVGLSSGRKLLVKRKRLVEEALQAQLAEPAEDARQASGDDEPHPGPASVARSPEDHDTALGGVLLRSTPITSGPRAKALLADTVGLAALQLTSQPDDFTGTRANAKRQEHGTSSGHDNDTADQTSRHTSRL